MTESELLDFTHRYLKEMGYDEPGQPWLIYAHHDTGNTHLHIITSRVAPDGRKIAHSHERRRSQEVIDRILGNDRKRRRKMTLMSPANTPFLLLPSLRQSWFLWDMRYIRKKG